MGITTLEGNGDMLPKTANAYELLLKINEVIVHEQRAIGLYYNALRMLEIYSIDTLDKNDIREIRTHVEKAIQDEYVHVNKLMDLAEKISLVKSERSHYIE